MIEIADQTNAERYVVQIIAVHVPAVDLAAPAIAHFNLAVSRGGSVPDHKMIGKTILHSAHVPVIIIEDTRVSLPCAAVMHHNELPATPFHRRASDRVDHGSRQITIVTRTARPGPETSFRRRRRWGLETLVFFQARFFDDNLSTLAAWSTRAFLFGRRRRRRDPDSLWALELRARTRVARSSVAGGGVFSGLGVSSCSRRFGFPRLLRFARNLLGFLLRISVSV